MDDDLPVDTELLRRPAASWTSTNAWFELMGDSVSLHPFYVCSLDGQPWQQCSSPRTYNTLPVGRHVFEVAVLDRDSERDTTPARWEWEVKASEAPSVAQVGARAPQVARGAAETVGRALKGRRWRAVLAGKRRVKLAAGPAQRWRLTTKVRR